MYNEGWHPGILGIPLISLLTAYRILLFGEISMHCCYRRRFPTKPDSLTPCPGEATKSMWTDERMWVFILLFLGRTDANFRAVSSLRRNCFSGLAGVPATLVCQRGRIPESCMALKSNATHAATSNLQLFWWNCFGRTLHSPFSSFPFLSFTAQPHSTSKHHHIFTFTPLSHHNCSAVRGWEEPRFELLTSAMYIFFHSRLRGHRSHGCSRSPAPTEKPEQICKTLHLWK